MHTSTAQNSIGMKHQDIISLDTDKAVSKYRQIVDSVIEAIQKGRLKTGDKIPSINAVCKQWNLSRDTVVNAYHELKARGIVSAAPGKGFYIESTHITLKHNIFVLFDELNSFKEVLYNAFLENIKKDTQVDIYFHHFNRKLFDKLIEEARGNYTTYVIMPAKFTHTLQTLQTLHGRVVILDQLPKELVNRYASVFQNFEKDTYQALMSGLKEIRKYQKLIMVYPGGKEPEGQYKGFLRFCQEVDMDHELIHDLHDRKITRGEAYLVVWDRDLVKLVKEAKAQNLTLGTHLGIISYNDTPLKEVVANGITTISTDFEKMGMLLARLVTGKDTPQIENSSSMIMRGSL